MMAVGNLPNELPRDASRYFGEQLIKYVLEDLFKRWIFGDSPGYHGAGRGDYGGVWVLARVCELLTPNAQRLTLNAQHMTANCQLPTANPACRQAGVNHSSPASAP